MEAADKTPLLAGSSRDSGYSSNTDKAVMDPDCQQITIDVNILSYAVRPARTIFEKINDRIRGVTPELVELLHGVYASFKPGELVCLMGSSGAGKTTLLNVISGRAGGVILGDIKYNGKVLSQREMRLSMNYIPQDDILMSALTPREVLNFTAELRLPLSLEERQRRVEELMETLGISRCADVMIGDALAKGISGGQKKRVSVGMELVNNPSILFVDEATTGLDSQTAEDLVGILRDIARSGRTVICTIHQPSYEVFSLFDKLLLLDAGRVVYNGRVDESKAYFERLGHKCREFINPIEYFMKVVAEEQPVIPREDNNLYSKDASLMAPLMHDGQRILERKETAWHQAWKNHSEALRLQTSKADLEKYHTMHGEGLSEGEFGDDRFDDLDYPTSFISQFYTLLRRSLWMTLKDPKQFRARLILVTVVGIFAGLVYFQLDDTQSNLQNRAAVCFQAIIFNGTNMLMNTVVLFPLERAVITREFRNGTYRMIAYYLGRVLTGLLFQAVYVFVFVTIMYWMIGLYAGFQQFFEFFSALLMLGAIAVTLGLVIGGIIPSVTMGPAIVTPMLLPLTVFSGFLVSPPSTIPVYFIWFYYISFFQYTYRIMLHSQLVGYEFACCGNDCDSTGQSNVVVSPTTAALGDYVNYPLRMIRSLAPRATNETEDALCPLGEGVHYGDEYLVQLYGNDPPITVGLSYVILGILLVILICLGFFVILWRGRQKIS